MLFRSDRDQERERKYLAEKAEEKRLQEERAVQRQREWDEREAKRKAERAAALEAATYAMNI